MERDNRGGSLADLSYLNAEKKGRSRDDHDPYYHHSYFPVAGNGGLRRRLPEQIGFIFRHEEGSDGTEKDQAAPAR